MIVKYSRLYYLVEEKDEIKEKKIGTRRRQKGNRLVACEEISTHFD